MSTATVVGNSSDGGSVRCYYELLEVDRQANDDELKKAYRRLALRWHPDKNPHRVEEATAHFRLVQKAYETLSDPQERAWYDKHRERILKGGLGRGDGYKEERLDVFQYFTSACYDDYDDAPQGFFTVYAKVFADLADEETRACKGDDEPPPEFPIFGRSDSDYEAVVGPFYSHWKTFFTRKSYVWVEQHDSREAPNKFVRKAMEKENRAAREAARRERNEEVRTLVAFIKKRDPRVKAEWRRLEARAREVEAKARAKAAADRRAHLETAGRYQAPEWARMADMEAELARLETAHGAGASESSEECDEGEPDAADTVADVEENGAEDACAEQEDALSGLVCLACEKLFRTPGAKLSHDRSKRHRCRIEQLRAELAAHDEEEEEVIGAPDSGGRPGREDSAAAEAPAAAARKSKKSKKKKRQQLQQQLEQSDSDQEKTEEVAEPASTGAAASVASAPAENDDEDDEDDTEATATTAAAATKKPRRRKDRQRQKQQELLEQRREEVSASADGGSGTQVCKACRQWFDSKTQLFKHLKESGHAAAKPAAVVAAAAAAAASEAAARTDGGKKSSNKRR